MGLTDLLSGLTSVSTKKKTTKSTNKKATIKKVTKKISGSSKKTKGSKTAIKFDGKVVTSVLSNLSKLSSLDLNSVLNSILNNSSIITALGKIGLKKEKDPGSSPVQKLVGSLKASIDKVTGVKIDDDLFSSVVTKLLGNKNVKNQVEDVAGTGVAAFIKKAVSKYIS